MLFEWNLGPLGSIIPKFTVSESRDEDFGMAPVTAVYFDDSEHGVVVVAVKRMLVGSCASHPSAICGEVGTDGTVFV